ncbi:MAG: trypsin-like serine peptidase [Candidatus Sericytochromatia bacterium]
MQKLALGLATLAALSTLAACQAPQMNRPVMLQGQNAAPLNAQSAAGLDNPDFVRKMRNPRQYVFQTEAVTSSICGPNDLQHVNSYDGKLGPSVEFVRKHQAPVAAMAKGTAESNRKFCSGTMIGPDLFLTASHCIDATITQDKFVVFNYQTLAGSAQLDQQESFKISGVIEDGNGGLDYAILRVEGNPGAKYGFTGVRASLPANGEPLIDIQHPKGEPKQIEAGTMSGVSGKYMLYGDLDTEPGSSGSGVLDKDGMLVGVHTNGGCYSGGGANRGVKMTEIIANSKVMQSLAQSRNLRR